MEIAKVDTYLNQKYSTETKQIQFICPICKSEKLLDFPTSAISNSKHLTTMSIAKGLICDHQFQAFVDKNFNVRGYQRVDFEFENNSNKKSEEAPDKYKYNDEKLFENLVIEGNFLEYNPNRQKIATNCEFNPKTTKKSNSLRSETEKPIYNKSTLLQIYNEFWEFIDDNNEQFSEFIKRDVRRNRSEQF